MEIIEESTSTNISLHGLALRFVSDGLLDAETAQNALSQAKKSRIAFTTFLSEKNILSSDIVALISSQNFGLPLLDLSLFDSHFIPKNIVSETLIRRHHVIPLFKRGDHLFIALSDPSNQLAIDEIKFYTGLHIQAVLVEPQKLVIMIEDILTEEHSAALGNLDDTALDDIDISSEEDEDSEENSTEVDVDDAPIVRFVHKILLDAIKKNVSDIHFEPYQTAYRVRFRIDGMLYEAANPPITLGSKIASRLKVMSRLDISERRIPQDGRFKLHLSKKKSINFRISTCPTIGGEKVVMRILDPTSAQIGIEALGMEAKQTEIFLETIAKPQGMVLVTGPTSSGKTVTLYTALNILNTIEKNISTVEDPVEIILQGVNQVNINTKTGLLFSTALRAFLRQDPDIIMVGEMRDLETAEIGIKAAQTGHLVLSTLHTNSAPETLTRFLNMGVEPYNVATSVTLIIAQRLARRLCTNCKIEENIPRESLLHQGFKDKELKKLAVFRASEGCDKCTGGYKGRVGLYEVMPVSASIGQLIIGGGSSLDIAEQALKEGLMTLRESGLNKVREGVTSLEEVNRVTKD